MYIHPFKPILIGIAAGVILFILPFFLLKAALLLLIMGGLFRLFSRRRYHWRQRTGLHPAFTDTIRQMTDEEYQSFRQSLEGGYPYHSRKEIPITD